MVKPELIDVAYRRILNNYDGITSTLFVESPDALDFELITPNLNTSKGAGIFAAYSFFDWNLKW